VLPSDFDWAMREASIRRTVTDTDSYAFFYIPTHETPMRGVRRHRYCVMGYPSSVAHYTSLEVLDKILNGALNESDGFITLHLSQISMMNDAGEGDFVLSRFFTDSMKKSELKKEWDSEYYPNHTPFVFSTVATDVETRNRGSLPMWKMYGDNCKGVLIRLNWKLLGKYCEERGYMFSACNYKSTQEISKMVADLNRRNATFQEIMQHSCFAKQLCWNYENEWRVVAFGNQDMIRTKTTSRGIIEYIELKIPLELIEEVCIGPLCVQDTTCSSLCLLKQKLENKFPGKVIFKVSKSNIPLK